MNQQFQRGDIILIHFPFTDLSGGKRRPAVVLAEYPPDVVVAFISSVLPAALAPSDVLLQPTVSTGLKKVSVLRSHKIATLEQGLVTRRLGRLDQPLLTSVDKALVSGLGIDTDPILQAEYQRLADIYQADGEWAVISAIQARV